MVMTQVYGAHARVPALKLDQIGTEKGTVYTIFKTNIELAVLTSDIQFRVL